MKSASTLRRAALPGLAAVAVFALLSACAPSSTEPTSAPTEAGTPSAGDCTPAHTFPTVHEGVLTVVGVDGPPSFYTVAGGSGFSGPEYDLIQAFAAENCLELDLTAMTGAAATLAMSETQADVMIGFIQQTEQRREQFNIPSNFLVHEALAIVSEEGYTTIQELAGKKVGVGSGSAAERLLSVSAPDLELSGYPGLPDGLADVEAGRIDAFIQGSIQVYYQVQVRDNGLTVHVLDADPAFPEETALQTTGWILTKGNDQLTTAVEDFYDQVHADGTLEKALKDNDIPNTEFYLNGR